MTIPRVAPAGLLTVALALVLLAGCAPATSMSSPSTRPSGGSATTVATRGALATRTIPAGATAQVDDASWAIADRLAAPAYTADTTAALVAGLAGAGIGTFADTTSAGPEQPVAGSLSPFRLLDFQAHALAVGAWAGSRFSGSELDSVVPLPPDLTGRRRHPTCWPPMSPRPIRPAARFRGP